MKFCQIYSQGMELVGVEISFEPFAEEIQEQRYFFFSFKVTGNLVD